MKEIFYDWSGFNSSIFYFLNHLGNIGILPQMLNCLSFLFNIENFVVYYIVLCGFSYFKFRKAYPVLDRGAAQEKDFMQLYKSLVQTGICYAIFGLVFALLKFSVNLPRPFCSLPAGTFETVINTIDERCMSAFPSSHAGIALTVTILAWKYLNFTCRTYAIIIVILVAFSRIVLAMHYPADIFYSYLIVLFVLGISKVTYKIFEHNIIKYVGKWIEKIIL